MKKQLIRDSIKHQMMTDDAFLTMTLAELYRRQGLNKGASKDVSAKDKLGFNIADSVILTHAYLAYKTRGVLTDKEKGTCRGRLPKYWRQVRDSGLMEMVKNA